MNNVLICIHAILIAILSFSITNIKTTLEAQSLYIKALEARVSIHSHWIKDLQDER
jgi:hypothetical protein